MASSSTTLQHMQVVSAAACPKCRLRLCTSLCAQTAHGEGEASTALHHRQKFCLLLVRRAC